MSSSDDLLNCSECKKLIEKTIQLYGSLDIVVCNVGDGKSLPPGKETINEWKKMFEANLQSATNVIESSKKPLLIYDKNKSKANSKD